MVQAQVGGFHNQLQSHRHTPKHHTYTHRRIQTPPFPPPPEALSGGLQRPHAPRCSRPLSADRWRRRGGGVPTAATGRAEARVRDGGREEERDWSSHFAAGPVCFASPPPPPQKTRLTTSRARSQLQKGNRRTGGPAPHFGVKSDFSTPPPNDVDHSPSQRSHSLSVD